MDAALVGSKLYVAVIAEGGYNSPERFGVAAHGGFLVAGSESSGLRGMDVVVDVPHAGPGTALALTDGVELWSAEMPNGPPGLLAQSARVVLFGGYDEHERWTAVGAGLKGPTPGCLSPNGQLDLSLGSEGEACSLVPEPPGEHSQPPEGLRHCSSARCPIGPSEASSAPIT